jgi:hypothetical protein
MPAGPTLTPFRWRWRTTWCALALAVLAGTAWAQASGGPYAVRKSVIASGTRAFGDTYALTVTAAQPVAGLATGGSYRMVVGIHPLRDNSGPIGDRLFCDGFESTACP